MRLLHPVTIRTIAHMDASEFKNATVSQRQILSHAWSEVFKFIGQDKPHPKVFISDQTTLGTYLRRVYDYGLIVGCKMNKDLLNKDIEMHNGFYNQCWQYTDQLMSNFDDNYLFSDAVSLYFKGVNIFPSLYGDKWRKLVPVESLQEIQRQITKTLSKED